MKILIVDDHEIIRDGLLMILKQSYCIDNCKQASEGYEAIKIAETFPADLVILDWSMPNGLDGVYALERLRKLLPEAKIVIFSMYDNMAFHKKAYELGADGFLIKQLKKDDLVQSLDRILASHKVFSQHVKDLLDHSDTVSELPITERETEVFNLTVRGYTQKEIAEMLDISIKTVENHRSRIGEKLKTCKRFEWVEIARKYNTFQI